MAERRGPFYLTIPSDKTLQGNRLNNFRVKHSAILLEGEWQVALAEMIYPVSHFNLTRCFFDMSVSSPIGGLAPEEASPPEEPTGNPTFSDFFFPAVGPDVDMPLPPAKYRPWFKNGENEAPPTIRVHLPDKHYSNAHEVVDTLRAVYANYWAVRRKGIEAAEEIQPYKDHDSGLIDAEEVEPNKEHELGLIDAAAGGVHFEYNPMDYRIKITVLGSGVDQVLPNEKLSYALGYRSKSPLGPGEHPAEYPPDLNVGMRNMFVYTDIIEPQIVGSVMTPLLKIIPIRGSFGDQQVAEFRHLHYVNVLLKDFDSIQFSIKDQTGLDIPFTSGQVIVKLHFRRKTLLM